MARFRTYEKSLSSPIPASSFPGSFLQEVVRVLSVMCNIFGHSSLKHVGEDNYNMPQFPWQPNKKRRGTNYDKTNATNETIDAQRSTSTEKPS